MKRKEEEKLPPSNERMIVAEISKNWPAARLDESIATLFEHVISRNRERGYKLHSWEFRQLRTDEHAFVETIIAVFAKDD